MHWSRSHTPEELEKYETFNNNITRRGGYIEVMSSFKDFDNLDAVEALPCFRR